MRSPKFKSGASCRINSKSSHYEADSGEYHWLSHGPCYACQFVGIAATPQPSRATAGRSWHCNSWVATLRGGSTQTSPPEKALGILRRCGARRATADRAARGDGKRSSASRRLRGGAARAGRVGNSVIVPSTDDIALKMEERQNRSVPLE